MKYRVGLAVLFIAPAFAFEACASFEDSLGAADAGPSPGTDASQDATSDDAAIDAKPFCRTFKGTFCEDFDDLASGSFPTNEVWDGGTIERVTDPHVSPPNGLRATLTLPTDSTCHYVLAANYNLDAGVPNGYLLEYKIRPATIPGKLLHGASAETMTSEPDAGADKRCTIYIESLPGGSNLFIEPLAPQLPPQKIPLTRKLVPGKWSHVVIDVAGPAGSRQVSVTIDGENAADDVAIMPECQNDVRLAHMSVGLICVTKDAVGDLDVAFDDIRVVAH